MYVMEDNTAAAYSCRAAEAEPSGSPAAMAMDGEAAANLHILAKQAESAYQYVEKPVYEAVKRIFDLVFASIALVVLSPLMLIVAIAIVIDDPSAGPIYTQMRTGRHGKEFRFHKFRSMVANADALKESLMDKNEMDGPVFKITDDPRVTKVGRFIRKSSIDELPQLINIIYGDMSIVGPRPPLPKEVEQYTEHQKHRLDVKGGLSCYWQISGRSDIGFEEWVRLDLQYIMERSIWTDVKIICRTFGQVLRMTGK